LEKVYQVTKQSLIRRTPAENNFDASWQRRSFSFTNQNSCVHLLWSANLLWAWYWTKAGVRYLPREWRDEAWPELTLLRSRLIGSLFPVILAALAVIGVIQEPDNCDSRDHLAAALGIVVRSPHSSLGGNSLYTSPLQAKSFERYSSLAVPVN